MPSENSVALRSETKRELAVLMGQLTITEGRSVTYDEVIQYLIRCLAELERLTEAGAGA